MNIVKRYGRKKCSICGGGLMSDIRTLVLGVVTPLKLGQKCSICGAGIK